MAAGLPAIERKVLSSAELPPAEAIFGVTAGMEMVRQRIESAALTNSPLLIVGERGTGKETIARFLHLKSFWSKGPFVKIDCATVPGELIESELFGYEKAGAAERSKPERQRTARLGTLLLNEIGALERGLQGRLLDSLEEHRFCRIGGAPERTMEARLIATASRGGEGNPVPLAACDKLLERLAATGILLPPLRERRQDIPFLIEYMRARYNHLFNRNTGPLSAGAIEVLENYRWPGNIRELEDVLRRYVILGQERLAISDVSGQSEFVFIPDISGRSGLALKSITRQVKHELERKLILRALEDNAWNRKKAASVLKISYRALLYKLRGSGIPSLRGRGSQKGLAALSEPVGAGVSRELGEVTAKTESMPDGSVVSTAGSK